MSEQIVFLLVQIALHWVNHLKEISDTLKNSLINFERTHRFSIMTQDIHAAESIQGTRDIADNVW